MRRRILFAAVAACLAVPVMAVAPASADGIAGYGMSALAVGVRYKLDSPGFLPTGDPAEGNIMDVDVPISRTSVSAGPLINAIASPLYPGDTAAHLGTAIATFGSPQAPPNYPIVAEANYPPTPDKGSDVTFSTNGVGEGHAQLSATGAKVFATTVAQTIEGVVDIGASVTRNDIKIEADKVTSVATSATGTIHIADLITIDGVIGGVRAVSDGKTAKPDGMLQIGRVTVAGQPAYIDSTGVHVVTAPGVGEGVTTGVQNMVNAALNTDGIAVRLIAPVTKVDHAAATATAGALAIIIDRQLPATGVPGFPALEIPGAPPVILGTPDLPLHIEILIGEARVGVAATSITPFDTGIVPDLGAVSNTDTFVGGETESSITGPGASFEGALSPVRPNEIGEAELGFQPAADKGRGRAIPFGFVLAGIFLAFALSGPLLGYARWQLLEGRHTQ